MSSSLLRLTSNPKTNHKRSCQCQDLLVCQLTSPENISCGGGDCRVLHNPWPKFPISILIQGSSFKSIVSKLRSHLNKRSLNLINIFIELIWNTRLGYKRSWEWTISPAWQGQASVYHDVPPHKGDLGLSDLDPEGHPNALFRVEGQLPFNHGSNGSASRVVPPVRRDGSQI